MQLLHLPSPSFFPALAFDCPCFLGVRRRSRKRDLGEWPKSQDSLSQADAYEAM